MQKWLNVIGLRYLVKLIRSELVDIGLPAVRLINPTKTKGKSSSFLKLLITYQVW